MVCWSVGGNLTGLGKAGRIENVQAINRRWVVDMTLLDKLVNKDVA